MAIHPSGSGTLSPAEVQHLALASAVAHSLAMVSILILVVGACGLTRRLAGPDRLAFSALIVYGFAAIAILIAAVVSGFIVPNLFEQRVRDTADAAITWHIVIAGIFEINQAFAGTFTVAASAAMALWSASALRCGGLGQGIAIYGCVVAAVLIVAICSGILRLNIHGMAIVALAQAIWFIGVGVQLAKDDPRVLLATGGQALHNS